MALRLEPKTLAMARRVAVNKTPDVSKDAAHSTANNSKKVVHKVDGKQG
jgi:hypothetical protein